MANLKVCIAIIAVAVLLCLSDPVVARRNYSNPIAINNSTNHTGPNQPQPPPSHNNGTNHTNPNPPPQPPPPHRNGTNHTNPNPPPQPPPSHNNGTNHTNPNPPPQPPPPHRNGTNRTGTDNGPVISGTAAKLSARALPVSNGKCIGSDCPSNIPSIPSIPSSDSDDEDDEEEEDETEQAPQQPRPSGNGSQPNPPPQPNNNGSFPQPPPHNNGTNHTGPNPPQPPPPHNNGTNHTNPNPPQPPPSHNNGTNHTKPEHGSKAECQNFEDCVNAIGGECLSDCINSACVLTGFDRCRRANAVVVSVLLAKDSPSAKTIQKTRRDIVKLLGVPSDSVVFLGQEKNGNGLLFEILDSEVMTANDAVFSLLTQVRQQTKAVKESELRGATVNVIRP